jgi:hypothetical protein
MNNTNTVKEKENTRTQENPPTEVDLMNKFGGATFTVTDDPDNANSYSVYADRDGSGCEVAGKIGERCVAIVLAQSLKMMCRGQLGD